MNHKIVICTLIGILFFYLSLKSCYGRQNLNKIFEVIKKHPIDFDLIELEGCDQIDILTILEKIDKFDEDSLKRRDSFIFYSKISDFTKRMVQNETFEHKDRYTIKILNFLKEKDFHTGLEVKTDREKLWYYLKKKKYKYIYSRFKSRGYHYYLLIALAIFSISLFIYKRLK